MSRFTAWTRSVWSAWMRSAWRDHLRVRLTVLDNDVNGLSDDVAGGRYKKLAQGFLASARLAVNRPGTLSAGWTGVDVEESWVSTHAAEVAILRGSTLDQVTASFPSLVEDCVAILPKDPRVLELQKLADASTAIDEKHHALLADTLESVYATSDAQHMQVRSFRNILLATTFLLSFLVGVVGLIGWLAPGRSRCAEQARRRSVRQAVPTRGAATSSWSSFWDFSRRRSRAPARSAS